MADENTSNGGRVTTQQFYEALLDIKEDISDMEKRILDKIDCIPVHSNQIIDICKHIDGLENDIDDIQKKGRVWDGINSVAVIVGTLIGARLGPK
jgi:hypothetical protein